MRGGLPNFGGSSGQGRCHRWSSFQAGQVRCQGRCHVVIYKEDDNNDNINDRGHRLSNDNNDNMTT